MTNFKKVVRDVMMPFGNLKVTLQFALYISFSCDADPMTLTKYVIALVKKDKPESDLKDLCLAELDVFLQQSKFSFSCVLSCKGFLSSVRLLKLFGLFNIGFPICTEN